MSLPTVSPVLHYLGLTRTTSPFFITASTWLWELEEERDLCAVDGGFTIHLWLEFRCVSAVIVRYQESYISGAKPFGVER